MRYPPRAAATHPRPVARVQSSRRAMAELVCPKCQSPMRSYERNAVTIDQCTGCRGVFLDRGELERLVDAEGAYYGQAGAVGGREEHRHEERYEERPVYVDPSTYRERHDEHSRGGYGRHRHRKREGFLGELFDF